jgi:ribosomal protein L24E
MEKTGICEYCGEKFEKKRWFKRFCNTKCSNRAWVKAHPRSGVNRPE